MNGINTKINTIQKLLVLVIFFTSTMLNGQVDCPEPAGSTILEVNNVRALVTNRQMSFYDGSDNLYEVPAGEGIHTFFASNLWIAGISPDGNLKCAAGTYEQNGSRFTSGPLNDLGTLDPGICEEYNRLYIVTREMSENHIQYFESLEAGTVLEDFPNGYLIPQELLDYPGTILTSTGDSGIGAPFADPNGDGIYNPLDGDFPLFSNMGDEASCEACETLGGDVSIFWIDNDMVGSFEDQVPLGIEIHNQVYAYASDGDIGNTLFYQKKIINKGMQTLNDTYVGLWADPDLGCFQDDFVGCDVERKLGIVYNGDNMDEDCIVSGFGEDPPAAGILALEWPIPDYTSEPIQNFGMTGFMTFSNVESFPMGSPQNAQQYYNLLKSKWLDGSDMTYGGIGMGGEVIATIAYPHETDPYSWGTQGILQYPWSEITAENVPGDRRFLMNFGPFTFEPGEQQCVIYATIFAPSDGSEDPLAAIQSVADNVKGMYDDCFDDLVNGIDDLEEADFAIVNWDQASAMLNLQSVIGTKTSLMIHDVQGKVIIQDTYQRKSFYDLSGFSNGIYMVSLTNVNGQTQTEKILKN